MKANKELELNQTPPLKYFFWINETKTYIKSDGKDAVIYIGLPVWTLRVGGK